MSNGVKNYSKFSQSHSNPNQKMIVYCLLDHYRFRLIPISYSAILRWKRSEKLYDGGWNGGEAGDVKLFAEAESEEGARKGSIAEVEVWLWMQMLRGGTSNGHAKGSQQTETWTSAVVKIKAV